MAPPLDKYDEDFTALQASEDALKSINLRRHRGNPEVREEVQAARDAVIRAHNALLAVERAEEDSLERG